jgi:glucose dehydrogenase
VAGADSGMRGFVAAFRISDGSLAWRRWTVPRRGEPGIETWTGKEPLTGGGSTWLTGSFDAATDTLYWATGNPWPLVFGPLTRSGGFSFLEWTLQPQPKQILVFLFV